MVMGAAGLGWDGVGHGCWFALVVGLGQSDGIRAEKSGTVRGT